MTRPEREKFWMVWRENGSGPTFRHYSREAAETEATRLSKAAPGDVFYVLKAVGGIVAADPVITKVKFVADDGIPF